MVGFIGLFQKEVLRFWRVFFQTVCAPALSALLYILIFSHVLSNHVQVYEGISYIDFLVPGLVMMSVLQNAFANSSSSLIQSKVTGNLLLILLPPVSALAFFMAYTLAAVVRGVVVGLSISICAYIFAPDLTIQSPLWILMFMLIGGAMSGALGVIVGLWAERFDQIALFTNFIVTPLTFLSGVFYSIHSLPPAWQFASKFNPFLYMIDGFRYGFFMASDVSPIISFLVSISIAVLVCAWAYYLIHKGYKIRH